MEKSVTYYYSSKVKINFFCFLFKRSGPWVEFLNFKAIDANNLICDSPNYNFFANFISLWTTNVSFLKYEEVSTNLKGKISEVFIKFCQLPCQKSTHKMIGISLFLTWSCHLRMGVSQKKVTKRPLTNSDGLGTH